MAGPLLHSSHDTTPLCPHSQLDGTYLGSGTPSLAGDGTYYHWGYTSLAKLAAGWPQPTDCMYATSVVGSSVDLAYDVYTGAHTDYVRCV